MKCQIMNKQCLFLCINSLSTRKKEKRIVLGRNMKERDRQDFTLTLL